MIEAKITLRNGNTVTILAKDFSELGEYIAMHDVKRVDARKIESTYEMRQGKESARNMGGY